MAKIPQVETNRIEWRKTWDQNIFQKSCQEALYPTYYFSYRDLVWFALGCILATIVNRYLLIRKQKLVTNPDDEKTL